MLNLSQAQVHDAVYTGIVHGNKNSAGVANFLAPVVNVDDISGLTIVMNDDAFVAPDNLYRAPGSNYDYYTPTFGSRQYSLKQQADAWSVPQEIDKITKTRAAKLDLRKQAIYTVMRRMENIWEVEIGNTLTNPSNYEASNSIDLSLTPSDQWDSPISNVEDQIVQASIIINRQVGIRPNKLLLSEAAMRALVTNPRIRDFLPRGTMVTEQSLANLFRLDEVKVASQTVITSGNNGRKEYVYDNSAILFYAPGKTESGLIAADSANRSQPSFAYQYILKGSPTASQEHFNELNDTYFGKIKVERSLELIGLGTNGLLGAGFLWNNVSSKKLTEI